MTWIGEEVDEAYYKAVMGIEINPGMDKSGFKIVFSPQHGTSNIPVRTCLGRLGYDVVPVLAQCAPDPDYTNTKSPNPEVDMAYELAIIKAKEVDADVVVICDPDGDRLGAVSYTHLDVYKRQLQSIYYQSFYNPPYFHTLYLKLSKKSRG